MSWPLKRLGEVATLERRSLLPEDIKSGTNYLGLEHIESGGRILGYQKVDDGDLKSNKFIFDLDTLLYGKLRPYLAKVCIPDREGCCSTDILPIRPGKYLDIDYLRHVLLWKPYVDKAASLCSGANLPRISPSALLGLEIPLPPLEEQRRIAAILDKSAELLAHLHERQTKLDALVKSMLVNTFGSPSEWHRQWPMQRIGDCCECLDKYRRPVKESDRIQGQIPYYGANGQQGWINDYLFDDSLVLVAEDGGHFHDRSRGVAYRIDGKSWVNNHAHILRPKSDILDIEFLHRVLRNYDFAPYISGSTRSKLTQGQLNEALVPVPPAVIQHLFSNRVNLVQSESARSGQATVVANALLRSVQDSIFSGSFSQ